MKKHKLSHPTDRFLIFVVIVLIGLLVGVLGSYGQRLNILWHLNDSNANSTGAISPYIQSSLKGLYPYQPVTDPLQKRVYFPEANFYVPLTTVSRQLVYGYGAASSDNPEQLTLSSVSNINTLPNTFADVPCLQRHITIVFDSAADADGKLVSTKKLANAHTLYIYAHQDGNCSGDRWSGYSANDITSLLNQARSY